MFTVYGGLGALLTGVIAFVLYLEGRPDLDVWHLADLDEEFTANSNIESFEQYLALEQRLFRQLDQEVYRRTGPVGDDLTNRYKGGSMADPRRWEPNWNRSFELPATDAQATILLLHGLSDSPYSLRSAGQDLHQAGAHVLGLRIPGHGTAPSGLVSVRWQDMAAAVELAVQHLARQHPDKPLYIIGYSNGAALALVYALAALENAELPQADRLVLISPEIGISSMAALAIWQSRLGRLFGLEKLAWNDILPEYDPFKYGSFTINAGDLSYRITAEIRQRISRAQATGQLAGMPPILSFTSAVDATVLAPDLVSNLYDQLLPGGHELVIYDINHVAGLSHLLKWRPDHMIKAVRDSAAKAFALTVVSNRDSGGREVLERACQPGMVACEDRPLGLEWPPEVYSLTHVALPFSPHDPVYGDDPSEASPGIRLGNVAWRGERGVLLISAATMLRLRWNPFYSYQDQRIRTFLGLHPRS